MVDPQEPVLTESNLHVALLVPDGVGIRNFLLGRFFLNAGKRCRLTVLHNIPEHLLDTYRTGGGDQVRWYPLRPHRETALSFLLRNSLVYAHLYWADTWSMRYARRRRSRGSLPWRVARSATKFVGRAAAFPSSIQFLDRLHSSFMNLRPEVEHYRHLFEEARPSVLFCSHQRPLEILPPVLAARSLHIPTATFIFSWDNLTSKGRIAAPFDHYLVWSEHMRDELVRYYPDVAPRRVHIVGTPQFAPYADESMILPRGSFFAQIGANPSRPLICYSGGDAGTCPEDPEHVRVLMTLIRSGQIRKDPQVVVRPSPVDDGERYSQVRRDFPELIFSQPVWLHTAVGEWASVIPFSEDLRLLANLTRYADLNINVASTMTLDFALHDKPVVNIAFDVAVPPPFGVPLWKYYYCREHYLPVVELGAARIARSPEELSLHVNCYLDDPVLDRAARKQLVDLEVGIPCGEASDRILTSLEAIAR